jgi:hypothetical protein
LSARDDAMARDLPAALPPIALPRAPVADAAVRGAMAARAGRHRRRER